MFRKKKDSPDKEKGHQKEENKIVTSFQFFTGVPRELKKVIFDYTNVKDQINLTRV